MMDMSSEEHTPGQHCLNSLPAATSCRISPRDGPLECPKKGLLGLPTELLWGIMGSLIEPRWQLALVETCTHTYKKLGTKFYEEQFDGRHMQYEWTLKLQPERDDSCFQLKFLLRYASFQGCTDLLTLGLERHPAYVDTPWEGTCSWAHELCEDDSDDETIPREPRPWRDAIFCLSPLHSAVQAQNTDTLQILLAHSADPNLDDGEGTTPLHFAVDEEVITLLLAAGASPLQKDISDEEWMSPLGAFLTWPLPRKPDGTKPHRSPAALRRLIDACRVADPDWSLSLWAGYTCMTPLEMAVEQDDLELVRTILEAGADPNAGFAADDAYVVPPGAKHPDDEPRLPHYIRPRLYTALHRAARLGGTRALDTMKLLVQYGARVNDIVDLQTALMHAVGVEDCAHETVRWLVKDCGADVNSVIRSPEAWEDPDQFYHWQDDKARIMSPILQAMSTRESYLSMINLLVELGADIRAISNAHTIGHVLGLWPLWYYSATFKWIKSKDSVQRKAFLRLLVENGADVNIGMRRTCYYVRRGSSNTSSMKRRIKSSIRDLRVLQRQRRLFAPSCLGCCNMIWYDYEPTIGRIVGAITSNDNPDTQKARVAQVQRVGVESLCIYQQYKSWTLLDQVMIYAEPDRLGGILELADPLSKLTHSSQMRNTALGKLIKTVNFAYTKRGVLGPWTNFEWTKAEIFLSAYGPRATAKYPVGLLAQGLAQSVARLGGARRQETRIRQYAHLTNYEGRWGADGISGLEVLVMHPAYWHFHVRKLQLGGYCAKGEQLGEIDDNLVRAAGVVHQLSKKSSRPPAAHEPHTPWWTTRFWEEEGRRRVRKRYQPLSDTEYHTAFAVLFGVQTETSPKYRRRKGRGGKSAKGGGTKS